MALLQIRLGSRILHVTNGLFLGNDVRQGEERRLQNGVRALAHANLYGQVNSVDGVEVDVVLRNVALRGGAQVLGELLGRPLAVHHEGTMRLHVVHDREVFLNVARVVTRHEVGLVDVIRAANGLVAETQVRNGHAAGFLGVVLEVRLHVFLGMVTDDFDGVLVRANRAVAAQAPELALDGAGRRGVRRIRVFRKREVGHVVDNAHGELATRSFLGELGENGEHRRGRRIFAAQAITAASNQNARAAFTVQGVDHVEVQRLARGAGLLRAVEHGDLLHGFRQAFDEFLRDERTIQANLHQADLLALGVQVVDNFLGHVANAAHGNNHALGVGSAVVVEQVVIGAQLFVDLLHVLFNDCGQLVVSLVAGLAVLEEDVAIFMAAAHCGMLGVQSMGAEVANGVEVAHLGQVVVIPHGDLLHLMRSAEAVEEVEERNAALDGGKVGDGGKVHDLLHVALGEHGEAGLAAGHNVGVVAEDVQRVGRNGTGAHMENARQHFGRDFVHVRNHEEQALRSSVGRGERARCQRTVHGTGGAAFGLHLAYLHASAEDVLHALRRPLVNKVGHGARRGDGVNARHLGERVRHPCGGVVAVHGFELSRHRLSPLPCTTCEPYNPLLPAPFLEKGTES